MPWIDEQGELTDECPACEQTRRDAETQITSMERELRSFRIKLSKAEAKAVQIEESKRDGKEWREIVAYWKAKFPDKRISAAGMTSARATAYFQRMSSGASKELFVLAIDGAEKLPFVVYGQRRQKGSTSDLRIDLQHIASIGNDAQFDQLVEAGLAAREEGGRGDLF